SAQSHTYWAGTETSMYKSRVNLVLTFAVSIMVVASESRAQTGPSTAPTTAPTATTRQNHNGNMRGVTTQPGGGLLLNFRDASIDNVLDELSSAAGFIVVKEVKPDPGKRVTLVSKQAVRPDEAITLLNT